MARPLSDAMLTALAAIDGARAPVYDVVGGLVNRRTARALVDRGLVERWTGGGPFGEWKITDAGRAVLAEQVTVSTSTSGSSPLSSLPPDRRPYVGEGADGCERSARIDEDEADTLDVTNPRRLDLIESARRWRDQAERIREHTLQGTPADRVEAFAAEWRTMVGLDPDSVYVLHTPRGRFELRTADLEAVVEQARG